LSYAWDYPSDSKHHSRTEPSKRVIEIDGQPFFIGENLFHFLSMARQSAVEELDLATAIWIDAQRIDQAKPSQRNHQVAQMGSVYQNASCVYVWLGRAPLLLCDLADLNTKHAPMTAVWGQLFMTGADGYRL
jgi:hypothetical protein